MLMFVSVMRHCFLGRWTCQLVSESYRLVLHSVTSSLGNIFWRTFTLLSPNNQDHTFMGDHIILALNQKTRLLLHLWRPYLTHTFNNALTVTLHISLNHLAAKIPYQLHNYFPSFLSSYETCSINVNPLFPCCH